jgi:hypothetical protein
MDIVMPATFPAEFRDFGLATRPFFHKILSDEDISDPFHKRTHFDWAWQAVRYRYRTCAECNDEFKGLLANPSECWQAGWGDEEFTYKLNRCIYTFFMSGLSVFESFGFGLYFLGGAVHPDSFPHVSSPKKITLHAASKAFAAAFPQTSITNCLAAMWQNSAFTTIDEFRNILAHRLSGRSSSRSSGVLHRDGLFSFTEEKNWHIPGSSETLTFDEEMLQRHLDEITVMLTALAKAAVEFAESHRPAQEAAVSV